MCNLFELAFALVSFRFARYTVLTRPNKDQTAVHGYGSTFIGSCHVGVSQSLLFYVVSALQLWRVAKGFHATRDCPKISRVMRDCAQLIRVIRDKIVQSDA